MEVIKQDFLQIFQGGEIEKMGDNSQKIKPSNIPTKTNQIRQPICVHLLC